MSDTSPHPLVVSFEGREPDAELLDWIGDGLVGGVVLFSENCPSDDHVRAVTTRLRDAAPSPGALRILIDEEGGGVRRLPDAESSMDDLESYGAMSDGLRAVAENYFHVAERLDDLGIDTLLAPVVDVAPADAAEDHWLRSRCYSSDAHEVAAMVERVTEAVQSIGVHACAKHFPGLGAATVDPHDDAVTIETTLTDWERTAAVPFISAAKAGTDAVMVGHQMLTAVDRQRPATLSAAVVRGLLCERVGYSGEILTDDLAMGAIAGHYPIESATRAALEAGCDRVLICRDRSLQRRAVSALGGRVRDTSRVSP